MIRDYISYEIQRNSSQIGSLNWQSKIREKSLTGLLPAAMDDFLTATEAPDRKRALGVWQEKNREDIDCLGELRRLWKEGEIYYKDLFQSPKIDLAILPAYSFVIQFTFILAQPYISRDEQDFYIIDNPIRKDKILGLPYVASTSWKGSLRSALWHLGYKEENDLIRYLFGNEKEPKDLKDFRAGRLYFYPTFFIYKSLEIINPQDRKLRAGKDPVQFESVPRDTKGTFTLLYVPFDLGGEEEKTIREQVAKELPLLATGLQAMFTIYGFGAKTSSGFGLAKEDAKGELCMKTGSRSQQFESFGQLVTTAESWIFE